MHGSLEQKILYYIHISGKDRCSADDAVNMFLRNCRCTLCGAGAVDWDELEAYVVTGRALRYLSKQEDNGSEDDDDETGDWSLSIYDLTCQNA